MFVAIIISLVISLIVYFGGGWCVYNIYLSCVDVDTLTFQDIYTISPCKP